MYGRDIYVRHSDKEGKSHVVCHRVWSSELFLASVSASARKEGGTVEQITEEAYKQERKSQR